MRTLARAAAPAFVAFAIAYFGLHFALEAGSAIGALVTIGLALATGIILYRVET